MLFLGHIKRPPTARAAIESFCSNKTFNHAEVDGIKPPTPQLYVIQKMILQFKPIDNQEPGILASLLFQSYADLIKSDPIHWKPEENNWNEFDRDAFVNIDTAGAGVFLSWHGRELVGFASFDPRQRPLCGIIGHNCILPEFRRHGFGKQQVNEILDRFIILGIQTARVTTNDNPFFVPAKRMYKSCGFQEISREPWEGDITQSLIHYQKRIGYRDRGKPHGSPLPHHAAYGSVLRGLADQAKSDSGEQI